MKSARAQRRHSQPEREDGSRKAKCKVGRIAEGGGDQEVQTKCANGELSQHQHEYQRRVGMLAAYTIEISGEEIARERAFGLVDRSWKCVGRGRRAWQELIGLTELDCVLLVDHGDTDGF